MSRERLECYEKEHFVDALTKLSKEYPAVFKWFVLEELRAIKPYSPYDRDDERNRYFELSKSDLEYLSGTPAPLKITIPVVIEKDDEQDP